MTFRLRTLGEFRLLDETGAEVQIPLGKPLALLAYLAIEGAASSRDELGRLLWPRSSHKRARHSVRQALSVIRSSLGTDVFEDADEEVRVHPGLIEVDLLDVLRLLDEGRVDDALALWGGPFVDHFSVGDGWEWEEWADAMRRDVSRRLGAAAVVRSQQMRDAGDLAEAERLAGLATRIAPTDGTAHLARARLLVDLERWSDLDDALDQARAALPEQRLTDALEELSVEARELQMAALSDSSDERLKPEMVGRAAEVALLRDQCRRGLRERATLAVVEGEPGSGKTSVCEKALLLAETEDAAVVRLRLSEAERPLQLGVVSLLARELLALPGAAGIHPATHRLLGSLSPSSGPGEAVQVLPGAIPQAMGDLVAALCHERPLVLFLDDLHWVDEMSAAILTQLLRRVEGGGVFTLVTTRPCAASDTPACRFLKALGSTGRLARVTLHPLNRSDVRELVETTFEVPEGAAAGTFADRLHEVSAGNALFLMEVLRRCRREGLVERGEDGWLLDPGRAMDAVVSSRDIDRLLDARVAEVGEDARAVLEEVLRTSRRTGMVKLCDQAGLSREACDRAVGELVARQIAELDSKKNVLIVHDQMRRRVERALAGGGGQPAEHPWPRWRGAAAAAAIAVLALATTGWALARWGGSPERLGGGDLYLRMGDSLVVVEMVEVGGRVRARVRQAEAWYPRGPRVYGPWWRAGNGLFWFDHVRSPDRPAHVERITEDGKRMIVVRGDHDVGLPEPSPSGAWLAWPEEAPEPPYHHRIMIARWDGSDRRVFKHVPGVTLVLEGWASDGSRVLIGADELPSRLLVVRPDGQTEATLEVGARVAAGWCGPGALVAFIQGPDDASRTLRFWDVAADSVHDTGIGPALGTRGGCSPDGRFVALSIVRDGWPVQVVLDRQDGSLVPLPFDQTPTRGIWMPREPPVVPSRVELPDSVHLQWGERARIGSRVVFTDGSRRTLPLEWRSLDPGVANMLPGDSVAGNAPGLARVVATWRKWWADTAVIRVRGDGPPRMLLADRFEPLDTSTWVLYGEPPPEAVRLDDGPALHLSGDGRWDDGVISRGAFDASRGFTLEYEFRRRLVRFDRQDVTACLLQWAPIPRRDPRDQDAWERRHRVCFHHPARELRFFDSTAVMLHDTEIPVPEVFPTDDWVHVALQVRPDGRVLVTLNDEIVRQALLRVPGLHEAPWRVALFGESVDTEAYVRDVRLWEGGAGQR